MPTLADQVWRARRAFPGLRRERGIHLTLGLKAAADLIHVVEQVLNERFPVGFVGGIKFAPVAFHPPGPGVFEDDPERRKLGRERLARVGLARADRKPFRLTL